MIKNTISYIINILCPTTFYTTIFSYYYDYIDITTYSLVLTNLSIIPSLLYCSSQLSILYPEYIFSYPIMFTSGLYHLCDNTKRFYDDLLCFTNYEFLKNIDYINSSILFIVYIISLTKYHPIIRIFINSLYSLILYIYFNYNYDDYYKNYDIIIILSSIIISFTKIILLYKNNTYIKNIQILISIITSTFAVVSFKFWKQIYGPGTYWFIHSYCWHVLIMLSSYTTLKYSYDKKSIQSIKS